MNYKARRSPDLDQYHDKPLTGKMLVQLHGWFWNCGNCERHIYGDSEKAVWVNDERCFCSEECRVRHDELNKKYLEKLK